MVRRRRSKSVKAEDFIKAYFKYDYYDEVAAALGISEYSISSYATRLRKAGVKLPYKYGRFVRKEKNFATEMNNLIEAIEASERPKQK